MDWSIWLELFALAVLVFFGYFIAAFLLPPSLSPLRLALAPGIGAGICSIIFFSFRRPFLSVEGALAVVLVFLLWRRGWKIAGLPISSWSGSVMAVVLPALTWALSIMVTRVSRMPHGAWDGWAIWNWEARLLVRAGSHWREGLDLAFHGDYPLLVPATTARLLRYAGTEVLGVGAWLGILLGLCSIAVVALVISELRGRWLGIPIAMVLAGTPLFINYASSQYADIPLSFFIVACLALLAIHFERMPDNLRIVALAGFLGGCAAWTKNEGWLFMTATGIALLVPLLRERTTNLRRLAAFSAGAALPLFVVTIFKLTISGRNDLIVNQHDTLQKMLDPERHATIWTSFGKLSYTFGDWSLSPLIPLALLVLLTGLKWTAIRNRGWLTVGAVISIVAAGYYVVYLTTPIELSVHLRSSMDRLMLHLWPSTLLLLGLSCRKAGDA